MDRRGFLRRSKAAGLGVAAGLTILPNAASVWGLPANERLSLAIVGLRNRGLALATAFAQRADCRIAYLCDADSSLQASRTDSVAKAQGGAAPKFVQDFRKALDDAVGRGRGHRHARSLALPGDDLGLRGQERCLRDRAAESRSVGRAAGGRGRAKARADRRRRPGLPKFRVWPERQEVHRFRQARQDPLLSRL